MKPRLLFAAALASLASLTACPACEPLAPLELPDEHCQPLLAGFDCMLPYPSDFFRRPDESMPGGFRVVHEGSAKLITDDGYSGDVNDWRPTEAFSRTNPIVAVLGRGVRDEGLVHIFDDRAASATSASKTLIIDTETGDLVPHFVDLDPRASTPERQAIILRPEVLLAEERRYVVALQGFVGDDGGEIAAPEGFRRLRDGRGKDDPATLPLADHFDANVFPVVEAAGVERARLQLAWDFTTGADRVIHEDTLRARELALAALETTPPAIVEINVIEPPDDEHVWREINGRLRGPRVMVDDDPGSLLARDDDGRVALNGETVFDFRIVVPKSVRDRFAPGVLLLYGHGFFGGLEEVTGEGATTILDGVGAVGVAIDWVGMSALDVGVVVNSVAEEVDTTPLFTVRVVQAMVNWLTLTAALEGAFLDEAVLQRPLDAGAPGVVEDAASPGTTNAGALLFAPAPLCFLGISMGHILGGVLSALHPKIERSVLHVGGAGFAHMMFRALPFNRYLKLLDFSLPDPLDQQKLTASLQRQLDPIDPVTYARYVLDEELPVGPSSNPSGRRVLLHYGIGDTQVPNFATDLHARVLGVPLVGPKVRAVWDVAEEPAPHEGSGLFQYDLGVDPSFYLEAQPQEDPTITHDELRLHDEPIAQMKAFFESGTIVSPCSGPCVLEPFPDVAPETDE